MNKPMSGFKDYILIIIYLFCILSIYNQINITLFGTLVTLYIILIIKLTKMNNRIRFSNTVIKQCLNSQRDNFIDSLSHDLRVPVIALLRIVELINNGHFGELNITQKNMMNQAEQSCKCILNLIALLINTYSFENESRHLLYEKFNISDLIINCFNELMNEAKEKNITFTFENIYKNLYIKADKEEIKNVLNNIIKTSIINANSGNTIRVKIKPYNKKIRLEISNITSNIENIEGIFQDKYTSIGESIRMHFCKKIIETHHGHILTANNRLNSYIFELPQMQ